MQQEKHEKDMAILNGETMQAHDYNCKHTGCYLGPFHSKTKNSQAGQTSRMTMYYITMATNEYQRKFPADDQ